MIDNPTDAVSQLQNRLSPLNVGSHAGKKRPVTVLQNCRRRCHGLIEGSLFPGNLRHRTGDRCLKTAARQITAVLGNL